MDTNILASSAIARAGSVADLFNRWRSGHYELAISGHIIGELAGVLAKPYFAARLGEWERAAFLGLVSTVATNVDITVAIPNVVSDPADNIVLATAESANARYLVSGDRELQRLGAYRGIRILSPSDFLALLDTEDMPDG
ncbi:MAG: putative toxin-antitoxin system toxin component, PIN family [Thermomicrobiales bacterium]